MNLPASFIDYTRALLGNEEYEKLAAALQQEPPVSIRINKLKNEELKNEELRIKNEELRMREDRLRMEEQNEGFEVKSRCGEPDMQSQSEDLTASTRLEESASSANSTSSEESALSKESTSSEKSTYNEKSGVTSRSAAHSSFFILHSSFSTSSEKSTYNEKSGVASRSAAHSSFFILHSSFFTSPFNKVPWATDGYYLDERLTFTFDPLFHAGCYYVQEASSMFVEQVLRQYVDSPVMMLDLCAAPGGKSTHARSVLPEGSLLVANEVIRNRSQVLAENLTKWGHPDVVVTSNDPADFSALPSFFDVILTDVPCSGEGMFRKDPVAVEEWSPENVEICWQRQRRIIADIWSSLKPGGILIYSTCTYNTKEDEENVHWIQQEFGAELLPVEVEDEWNITGNLWDGAGESQKRFPVYHFLPHKTKGEGFFLAALRKPDAEEETTEYYFSKSKASRKKDKKGGAAASLVSKENMAVALNWLNKENAEKYTLSAEGVGIVAFPQRYTDELAAMKQHLKVVQAGVLVGEVKGRDLTPAHALAMSASLLRQDAFNVEEVSYEQAIAYLRKEAITLSETAPRGYVLLTYRNIPLGFVKNIGNRANNLYPQEWRIRSGYLPEEIRTL